MKNKVLLVDDSITIHRVIDLSIDTDNYETIKVFSEEASTQKLKETPFKFVLLDYKLENTNIPSYIATIKNIQPSAKVILLIGAFDKFDPKDLNSSGADDYLVKPFDSQSLNTKLAIAPDTQNHSEDTNPYVSSPAEPTEMEESLPETPLNDNFIKNMAQADIERENTVTTPQAPKPINTGSLFHDPSVNPSQVAVKGNQIPLEQRKNPFEEDSLPEPKEETFDPTTQFADLKLVPENDDNLVSPLDNIQNKPNTDNTIDSGFAKEKTFAYSDSDTPTVPEAEFGAGGVSSEKGSYEENIELYDPSGETVAARNPETEYAPDAQTPFPDQTPFTSAKDQSIQTNDSGDYVIPSFDANGREADTLSLDTKNSSENILNQYTETPDQSGSEDVKPKAAETFSTEPREINMDKTDGTDFYRLDDDEIFNNKPVTQIFEEEILSLNSPEKENATGKPLSQKFEEEILSVEEPREMQFQQTAETQTQSEKTEFYDPANLENITQDPGYTKNISQKFEEEILSIDTPNEENQLINQDYTERKNIGETFDDEILSMSSPESDETPSLSDIPSDPQTSAATADSFMNDDFMTKEFAEDIFPKDNITDNRETVSGDTMFQAAQTPEEKSDDDIFEAEIKNIAESSENLFTAETTQPNKLYDDIFNESIQTPENQPSVMDETLDLDKLLEMDLAEFSATPSANFNPPAEHKDFLTEEIKSAAKDTGDDPLFSKPSEQDFTDKPEDDIFAFAAPKAPKTESLKENTDDADFDMVQMDVTTPVSKEPGDSILSGITVTISKEEIMKMLGNALDKHFLEKAVQEVLAQNMREIVRAVVPAIAEKFIKEEIEKLKDN